MKKSVATILLCLVNFFAFAQEEPTPLPPVDEKYMGVHPMVLVSNGSRIYASVMPTYEEPRNVQLIYDLDNTNLPLLNLVRDADLVTIVPSAFNLEHLIRGERLTINADVYMGHFQRGGMLTYKNIEILLDSQLYLRKLEELEQSHIRQKYESALLPNNQRLLVHQIQAAPSYDQIILLFDDVTCITEFVSKSAVPSANETYRKLGFCGSMKPLYYEYQDFEK
ncbi:MAG: hypothetical protein NWQ54_04015 [Paraglaciecola sp.]|uniref:hypothetical protein n=1 Tax=Paraglaciecola sp. TaxID=1920173 RepID=UPI00273E6EE0|nr:hypothetical protein [Paraglaciecola sp.]MDP5032299.1 hypothetical protein [Paraglaciecola sp.]MDP5130022.1 hypothetical protein [Paraglaciecola sp.]